MSGYVEGERPGIYAEHELGGYKADRRSIISQHRDEAGNVDIHSNGFLASLCRTGLVSVPASHSFEAAPTLAASRFEGDAPKARARPESAATVITGREA